MARIHELVNQIKDIDSVLAEEISKEVAALSNRREFGLNFERHTPEQVELPGRQVRKGDKVHILAPRGETSKAENKIMWVVMAIDREAAAATIRPHRGDGEKKDVPLEDLVVVAEFRDPIYPGLVSTGKVVRGGDKPFHTVINAENFHALEALLFTHSGKVDAIYIDPPYNTGARDWKYNNDYVESEDNYRNSKWLAFMERRLMLAKELLKPDTGVLVATIDENEHARLAILLEQIFDAYSVTSVTVVHNPRGVQGNNFSYTHEYAIFVTPKGKKSIAGRPLSPEEAKANTSNLRNWGGESLRSDAKNCFYPIYVKGDSIVSFGDVPDDDFHPKANDKGPDGSTAVWPIDENGIERKWRYARQTVEGIKTLLVSKVARNGDIAVHLSKDEGKYRTVWQDSRHDASTYGSQLVTTITGRKFPFPKSLYAVYDALHAATSNTPEALIVDFFSGSGTTAHAAMLLNRADNGRRQVISVTNNEVSDEEQKSLRLQGLRPGDDGWEMYGICDYITKPRIAAAISGKTPNGEELVGEYKVTGEPKMKDGFQENAEFFTLTYENSLDVLAGRNFKSLAPLLWLRAGGQGPRIEDVPKGWATTSRYGVLTNLDKIADFIAEIPETAEFSHAFIFTEEDRLFEDIAQSLPSHLEIIRMPAAYLRNSEQDAIGVTR